MKKYLSVFLSALILLFLFCGCKNKDTVSSTPTLNSISEASSSQIDVNSVASADITDPQNIEDNRENGTEVEAQKLTVKQGVTNGIDVSKWQGKNDWKKVKASNMDFAIIRIGYRAENGTIYKDEFADYNIQQADKAGILIGIYFFSTAVSKAEATAEAEWAAEAIKSYPISYPVVYDCEGYTDPNSRMYNLTNAERTQNAVTFLNKIQSYGYEGMLYASKNELLNYWETYVLEPSYKIWIARYTNPAYPSTPAPDYNGKYDMWQYTNKGIVSGINSPTDMIVSYFTKEKAAPKSNVTPPTVKEPVIKDSTYTDQKDTVTAKDTVNLRDSASTNSNIIGTLKNGETLQRIAVGSNGWSKLLYQGKTVFAISSYLTTDLNFKPVTSEPDSVYTNVNETVTAKSETNLRNEAKTSGSTVIYTLKNGETVTRTGIGSNGWSRLNFNGQTVYAVSSFLTTDLSYKEPQNQQSVSSATSNTEIRFDDVNDSVTAKEETNLRDKPSTNDSSVVYTLKNGEYLTRTGKSSNGWSRLVFNGQTVYAVTSFLTN